MSHDNVSFDRYTPVKDMNACIMWFNTNQCNIVAWHKILSNFPISKFNRLIQKIYEMDSSLKTKLTFPTYIINMTSNFTKSSYTLYYIRKFLSENFL